jgi:uncharacterized membrane protein YedE/YeeE
MTFFPFASLSGAQRPLGLLVAVAVGFAFGFVLERVGFGRAQKLVGQFHGTDLSVLKVIFAAIVTAMLGSVILSGLGLLDLAAVASRYPTFMWPMVVGGFLLGVGFVVSGYCPGTSFVGAASGKLDALATIGGIVTGTLLYSELQAAIPALARFHSGSGMGPYSLWQLLGVRPAVVAAGVVVLAIGAFAVAERVEQTVGGKAPGDPAPRTVVFVSLALFALAGLSTMLVPSRTVAAQGCPPGATAQAPQCRPPGLP